MQKRHIPYNIKRRIVIAIAIIILGALYFFRNLSDIIITASAISLIVLFYLVDHMFDLRFKTRHYVFITAIAITGFLLSPLYSIYPSYDKWLHFIQPILFSSIVFHMTSSLNLKLKWRLVFTFFVVGGGIGLFEIGEYTLDYFFDLNLQGVFLKNLQNIEVILSVVQDPIDDTMTDMILGFISSFLYALTTYIYLRNKAR